MDNREEAAAFLRSRRDRITPEQAGLPVYGLRRVAGLRRGEVAMLAGVSVEYYTRLERGNLKGVSGSVLDAVALALRLDDTERMHLYDLARAAGGSATQRRAARGDAASVVRPSVRRIIEGMPDLPAFVTNDRLDTLAANPLGRALFAPMFADPTRSPNTARFAFLDPASRRFYVDRERVTRDAVGVLRVAAGKNPHDPELIRLIGELSTRSEEFRSLWGARDVHVFRQGVKRFRHPVVGELELDHESMLLPGEDGLSVVVYSAAPGSAATDALTLLASWSATAGREQRLGAPSG
ncbi:helix-turn-helix domain-containing protein [Kitasatospora sp. CB02891]|uniref:helix-turn-helix domain-containing protein n=1 Tax=Kitasatospora sp. CB02891 TaxID=2020329 RepID=UPI000C27A7D7|nr:helix-turn-helix transcriptional regulator [Kitasatospora sp. CB02891]PJN29177.1 transcriptional regulator [Kitasatospora sp. CB02891]